MDYLIGKRIKNYEIQKKVGEGCSASVYQAIHVPTRFIVAIKVIPKLLFTLENHCSFINEIKIIKSLHHPFIAEFLDFFQTTTFYFIVMEYVCHGNLYDYIRENGKLKEIIAHRIFTQLLSVLQYLHELKNIAHRDLKPQNIMLDENYDIRLVDFGVSYCYQETSDKMKTKCGTPSYMAPEIILGRSYSEKCDLWSAGIILYFMISGYFPFSNENMQNLLTQIIHQEPDYSSKSPEIVEVLKGLLTKNPQNRFSFAQIRVLKWFSKKRYDTLLNSILKETLDAKIIDQEIMNQMLSFGLDCHNLEKNLLSDENNISTISYRILKKEKLKHHMKVLHLNSEYAINTALTKKLLFSSQKLQQSIRNLNTENLANFKNEDHWQPELIKGNIINVLSKNIRHSFIHREPNLKCRSYFTSPKKHLTQ
jgi:5'-AMP-activated protein kinase catalytic alpha subunit